MAALAGPDAAAMNRELIFAAAAQGFAALGGLALLKVQGVLLTPEQFGLLALALNSAAFIQGALVAGQSSAAIRFAGLAVEDGRGRELLRALFRLVRERAMFTLPIAGLALAATVAAGWITSGLALGAVVLSFAQAASALADGWIVSRRRQQLFAGLMLLGSMLRLCGLAIGALLAQANGLAVECGALTGLAGAWCCTAVVQWSFLRADLLGQGQTDRAKDRDWLTEAKIYARPYLPWTLAGWSQTAAERWSLSLVRGSAEVGLFAALSQLCMAPVGMLSAIITNYALPRLSARWDGLSPREGEMTRWWRLAYLGGVAIIAGALLAYGLGPWLISLLLSDRYLEAAAYLPLLAGAAGCMGLAQALTTPIVAVDPEILARAKWVSPLIAAGGAIIGAIGWGLPGVAVAAVVGNLIYLGWVVRCLRIISQRPVVEP